MTREEPTCSQVGEDTISTSCEEGQSLIFLLCSSPKHQLSSDNLHS